VIENVQFNHAGDKLAAAVFESQLRVYSVTSGELEFQLDCPCRDTRAVAFSPFDNLLVAGGRNGKVRVWNMESGDQVHEYAPHGRRIRDITFDRTGRYVITCGDDRSIKTLDLESDQLRTLPLVSGKVFALSLVGDHLLATGGSDNKITIWNLDEGRVEQTLTGHTGSIAVLSCDDGVLASGSFDTTVRIWRLDEHGRVRRTTNSRPVRERTPQ
jgi:WD40 repeat protein